MLCFSGSEYAGCVMNLRQMKKMKDVGQSDHSETDRGSLGQGGLCCVMLFNVVVIVLYLPPTRVLVPGPWTLM